MMPRESAPGCSSSAGGAVMMMLDDKKNASSHIFQFSELVQELVASNALLEAGRGKSTETY